MPRELKELPASFYRTIAGTVPVRDRLLSLDPADRTTYRRHYLFGRVRLADRHAGVPAHEAGIGGDP